MTEVFLGSAVFVGIVLALVGMVLSARAVLMPSGNVTVRVNGRQDITARAGDKLLSALADGGIAVGFGPDRRVELALEATNLFDDAVQQHLLGDVIGRKATAELRFRF